MLRVAAQPVKSLSKVTARLLDSFRIFSVNRPEMRRIHNSARGKPTASSVELFVESV